jgi:hypothetical protein
VAADWEVDRAWTHEWSMGTPQKAWEAFKSPDGFFGQPIHDLWLMNPQSMDNLSKPQEAGPLPGTAEVWRVFKLLGPFWRP